MCYTDIQPSDFGMCGVILMGKHLKTDRRTTLSRTAIREAFRRLLERSELNRITVKELCAEAAVNRSTFYERYGTIQAVLEDCLEDYFIRLDQTIRKEAPGSEKYAGGDLMPAIRFFDENLHEYDLLAKAAGADVITAYVCRRYVARNLNPKAAFGERMQMLHRVIGDFSVFLAWIHEGRPCSEEELSCLLRGMM